MEDEVLSTEENTSAEELSMDETIRKTLEEIESREPENRDESGKFTSKNPEPEKEKPEEPKAEENTADAEKPSEAQTDFVVPVELQRMGIRKEAAAAIAKDPVVMQEFMRRSEEMHRGLETYREKAAIGDNFQKAIAPFMENIQAAGVEPVQAVQALFNADNILRKGSPQQKLQAISQLAREYGIDIQQAAQAPQQAFDPVSFRLQQEMEELKRWKEEQNQLLLSQQQETLNSEINRFAAQPDKEYFQEVRNDMAGLLQAGLASDLQDAYEKACYANPTVRNKMLAQQQAKAEAERKAQAAQKAQAAKQASAVNVARKGTLPSAKPIGSMDDTIRETARELGLI